MKLVAGQRILVEGDALREDGAFVTLSDESLKVIRRSENRARAIRWADVRRISRRAGRERVWAFPLVLGIIGGVALGSGGFLLDSISRSPAGHVNNSLGATALLYGAAGGAVFGLLMMWAVPGPWWEPLYEVPVGTQPVSEQPLAQRLASGAVPEAARKQLATRQSGKTVLAWIVLCTVMLGALGFCTHWQ